MYQVPTMKEIAAWSDTKLLDTYEDLVSAILDIDGLRFYKICRAELRRRMNGGVYREL